MIKVGKICNASDSCRNITQHHIAKKTITNTNSDKQSDDEKSKSSKSIKSAKINKAASITKLRNYQIKTKKEFTTLNTIIEEIDNEESDLTNSDCDVKESHI